MKGEIVLPASPPRAIRGPILRVDEPFSFWGGVDPTSGRITDPRTANHGQTVAGTVLVIRELRGSSSTSAVLLELIHRGVAPAAIVVSHVDAILMLGAIVAREMGWTTPPIVRLPRSRQLELQTDRRSTIDVAGTFAFEMSPDPPETLAAP